MTQNDAKKHKCDFCDYSSNRKYDLKRHCNSKCHIDKIDKTKLPMLPAIVLFGLILVNFGPLNNLPNKYPPMSVAIEIIKTKTKRSCI